MIKFLIQLTIIIVVFQSSLLGQGVEKLSLEDAYQWMEANYPFQNDASNLQQIHQLQKEQLKNSRLPSIYLKADGRLQSESIQLEAEGLPFAINRPLYSLNGFFEAQYLILDGGARKAQDLMLTAQLESSLKDVEVESYQQKARINQIFLAISMLRAQNDALELSVKDIEARKAAVQAAVEEGSLLESELKKIEVKAIELDTRKENLAYEIEGLVKTLSYYTGKEINPDVELVFPALASPLIVPDIQRPELEGFKLKREAILAKSQLIDSEKKPKLSAFAQGGVGYPNPLNILDTDLAPYGLVGAQFSWKLVDWKKSKKDKEILALQAQKLNQAEENFTFNMKSQTSSYLTTVERLLFQIEKEKEIAGFQADILTQMAAQLDEGVITSADYISQVNAELLARQNLLIHQIELQKAQLEFWNQMGALSK